MNDRACVPVEKPRPSRIRRGVHRILKTAAAALIIAYTVKLTAAEVFVVRGRCVAPEIPDHGRVLVYKLSHEFAAGDIVVFRRGEHHYLGRVVGFDRAAGVLTVARNGEPNQAVSLDEVIGRGVANTR